MSLALFLLLILSTTAVIAVLARLLAPRTPWELEEAPERFQALQRAYERALRTIKDLEFDFQAGTLSAGEHAQLRGEYKEKAVSLRRALERSRQAAARQIADGKSGALSRGERERLEALVAGARTRKRA